MIEIIGWITIYIIIGISLLPFPMLFDSVPPKSFNKEYLIGYVLLWVVVFPFSIVLLWLCGWDEYKNYNEKSNQ